MKGCFEGFLRPRLRKEIVYIGVLSSLLHTHSDSVSGVPLASESSAKVPRGPKDAVLSPPSRNDSGVFV